MAVHLDPHRTVTVTVTANKRTFRIIPVSISLITPSITSHSKVTPMINTPTTPRIRRAKTVMITIRIWKMTLIPAIRSADLRKTDRNWKSGRRLHERMRWSAFAFAECNDVHYNLCFEFCLMSNYDDDGSF